MRIDEKEDILYRLCSKYGMALSYSWGYYHVNLGIDGMRFSRDELREWGEEEIEFFILELLTDILFQ